MEFFILAKTVTYLFLSLSSPTTLVFEGPIEYVSAGKQGDFSLHRSNNHKILIIQPLKEVAETNMVVVTTDQHYQFKIQTVAETGHHFIYVYQGAINKTFSKKLETTDFRILEGDSSSLIQNKLDFPIEVNGVQVIREGYFSKGAPVIINHKRVLN